MSSSDSVPLEASGIEIASVDCCFLVLIGCDVALSQSPGVRDHVI
jgi:hypothetical protein